MAENKKHNQIAILDFGSQYTHLISRRIRGLSVLTGIYQNNIKAEKIPKNTVGIILSGGPNSVHDKTALAYDSKIFELGVPILGLCYGHQLIGMHFGGRVTPGKTKEYGLANIYNKKKSKIFKGIPSKNQVWMSHGDSVSKLPKGFEIIAKTSDCPVAAMQNTQKNIYGFQFHPEVRHTNKGTQILSNFIFNICGAKADWKIDDLIQELKKNIRLKARGKKVFLLVSGGVDSTVAFALLEKALGKKNVQGIHIDTGFLRYSESARADKALKKAGFNDLHIVNAEHDYMKNLKGVFDPEKKRKIIGKLFLSVTEKEAKKRGISLAHWIIGQGTIYPDTIESGGTKNAHTIKTHHNRINKINRLIAEGKIIEPISGFYKDEVRLIGKELGISKNLLERHPFPGPGLAIRALCAEKPQECAVKDAKLKAFARAFLKKPAKFEIFSLPVKSVGVQGDGRSYANPAIMQGITDWKKAGLLATAIANKFGEINRVTLLVHPKHISKKDISVKPSYLTKNRLDLLRKVDEIVYKEIKKLKIYNEIWQFPVILAPLAINKGETIILRPIQSDEAMTANFYQMKKCHLNHLVRKILAVSGVDMVLYDITNKPPGTIEWE